MAHEIDAARGGCPFSRFFETTPHELIGDGLYSDLAFLFFPGVHCQVSLALLGKALGETAVRRTSRARVRDTCESSASVTARKKETPAAEPSQNLCA